MANRLSLVAYRLIWLPPTLLGLLAFVFVLSRVVAGDPAALVAGETATIEQVQHLRRQLGFDRPLPEQFADYLGDVAHGRLGTSIYTRQPIVEDLAARLPATLELTLAALLLAALVGIPLGVFCGLHRNGWPDHAVRLATVCCMAVSSFWIAIQFQLLFSMHLNWLPLSGRIDGFPPVPVTGFMIVDALIEGEAAGLVSAVRHMVLPALTLALPVVAAVLRFTRAGVIDAVNAPSVAYLTAMGLPRRVIVWKYVLRLSLTATVTQLGLTFGILLTGAVVVETIFDWPGLGAYAVRSVLHSDYNAVIGLTLCTGALFALINLLVDLLQTAIDPRGTA